MPVIQTKGAMSSQGLGEFAQQSGGALYVEDVFSTYLYTGNGTIQPITNGLPLGTTASWTMAQVYLGDSYAYESAIDGSGNVYIVGYLQSPGYTAFLVKYSSTGSIIWQRTIGQNTTYGYAIALDTVGNVLLVGAPNDGTRQYGLLAKYDSSGTLLWQRKIYQNTGSYLYDVATDSSNNVFAVGQANDGTRNYGLITKYNSSGTLQWQRKYYNSSGNATGVDVDPSGNVLVVGKAVDGYVAKYNTSGVLQWQQKVGQGVTYLNAVKTDSAGSVYVIGRANDGSRNYALIAKYDLAGTLQWHRKLYDGNSNGYGITVDASDNVYVSGDTSSTNYPFVAKYNGSGVLQWQRSFTYVDSVGNRQSGQNYGIVASGTNVYVTGYSYTSASGSALGFGYNVKLAQDGSTISGTVNGLTIYSGNLTDEPSTATFSAGTGVDAAGTATETAGGATDAAGSATLAFGTQNAVAGKGGLVWIKCRSNAEDNLLEAFDILADQRTELISNSTTSGAINPLGVGSFRNSANGFTILGGVGAANVSPNTYASWTFVEQPKFFDAVPFTSNSSGGATFAHSLGGTPGCVIIKSTGSTSNWDVYHRSTGTSSLLRLNLTNAAAASAAWITPTASSITIASGQLNASTTYEAFLFAHDTAADGVIQCGSIPVGTTTVTLGWEPQWVLWKASSTTSDWIISDNMRGMPASPGDTKWLYPNSTSAETTPGGTYVEPTATGFIDNGVSTSTRIYIAIRRGPMRTPASSANVFSVSTSSITTGTIRSGFPTDLVMELDRATGSAPYNRGFQDRLRGDFRTLSCANTTSEDVNTTTASFASSVGTVLNGGPVYADGYVYPQFRRAPVFFDEVCYAGTGTTASKNHNLGAVPELIIWKARTGTTAAPFVVNFGLLGSWDDFMSMADATAKSNVANFFSTPTATTFAPGSAGANDLYLNNTACTYVAYLFATCPGVSKVGSYVGTGSTLQINCGFSGGTRFVLIKRTNGAGDWYVWDSARGIVAGNDPYLLLNNPAPEVTTTDWVDTYNLGFELSNSVGNNVNINGATYIFLAIA